MSTENSLENFDQKQEEENQRIINLCTLKLEKDPTSKKALLLRGNIYIKTGEYDLAEEDLKKLLNDSLLNSTCYFLLGCIYRDKKDYNKSIEFLTKSIELDSNNINSLFLRGAVFNIIGKYNEAINDYSNAIKLDSMLDSRKNIYKNISQIFEIDSNEKDVLNDNLNNKKNDSLNDEKTFSIIESTHDGSLYNFHTVGNHRNSTFDLDFEINNYLKNKFTKDFNNERTKSLSFILSTLPHSEELIKNNNKNSFDNIEEKSISNKEDNDSDSSSLNKSDFIFIDSVSKNEEKLINKLKFKNKDDDIIKKDSSDNIKNLSTIKRKLNLNN